MSCVISQTGVFGFYIYGKSLRKRENCKFKWKQDLPTIVCKDPLAFTPLSIK